MVFKRTKGDVVFDIFLYLFMAISAAIFIYPFWTVLAMSLNDAKDTALGGVYLWPRKFTLLNFKTVLENANLLNAYLITVSKTVIGTTVHVLATGMFAFALSKKGLVFRKFYFTLCIITMFFGGGLIPSVINMRNLGFMNNYLVYIIPAMYSVMDMLIMKTFFNSLPASLEESAKIDGANPMTVFFRIILPSSKPVIATIALMNAVGQWNSWFDAYLYITVDELKPVQLFLQQIITSAQGAASVAGGNASSGIGLTNVTPYSIQLATLVIAIGPIIFVYPFFQRYFIKGFMLGAIKE